MFQFNLSLEESELSENLIYLCFKIFRSRSTIQNYKLYSLYYVFAH